MTRAWSWSSGSPISFISQLNKFYEEKRSQSYILAAVRCFNNIWMNMLMSTVLRPPADGHDTDVSSCFSDISGAIFLLSSQNLP